MRKTMKFAKRGASLQICGSENQHILYGAKCILDNKQITTANFPTNLPINPNYKSTVTAYHFSLVRSIFPRIVTQMLPQPSITIVFAMICKPKLIIFRKAVGNDGWGSHPIFWPGGSAASDVPASLGLGQSIALTESMQLRGKRLRSRFLRKKIKQTLPIQRHGEGSRFAGGEPFGGLDSRLLFDRVASATLGESRAV